MTYAQAKAHLAELDAAASVAGKLLSSYPRGPMGLTPDSIKATPKWRGERAAYDAAAKRLRTFGGWFVKAFAKEYRAERRAKLESRTTARTAGSKDE